MYRYYVENGSKLSRNVYDWKNQLRHFDHLEFFIEYKVVHA